jgi:GT2 family glycosyltransferase
MNAHPMKIGAVIVTFNSAGHIAACLAACANYASQLEAGIVVVDNASSDATTQLAAAFPGVTLIANSHNAGFAAAANQGFEALPAADAILLLNPDARILSSPSLLAQPLIDDPSTAAAGGMLLAVSGQSQRGFQFRRFPTPTALAFEVLGLNRLFPWNPINRRYRALDLDPSQPAENIQPAGACVLIRRKAWLRVGGFDQRFFPIWFEDVDFLKRLAAAAWHIRYIPAFRAAHEGAHSIGQLRRSSRHLYWYSSLLRYASLHFGPLGRGLVCWAVVVGVLPRTVTGMLLERSIQPLRVYGRLVRLSITYLSGGHYLTS